VGTGCGRPFIDYNVGRRAKAFRPTCTLHSPVRSQYLFLQKLSIFC
jgi:hypothetical protein